MTESKPRVLIIGGGFGGLAAARELKNEAVDVVVLDRRNHHLFQPLLYQVAMAGLAGPDISSPIRGLLRKQKNATVLMVGAEEIDLDRRVVKAASGEIPYDYLIIAAGARTQFFGNDSWRKVALGLKTLEDALQLRARILSAFERAEIEPDAESRRPWLTFVVIGGGPTGVEMAGSLREVSRHAIRRDFRRCDPSEARVVLIEAAPSLLGGFPDELAQAARAQLEDLGVEVRVGCPVQNVDSRGVQLEGEFIESHTVVWAAGVRAQDIAETLPVKLDRGFRIPVDEDLSLADHPEVFAVGDIAHFEQEGQPLPGVAPVAIQQGRHAARNILRHVSGRPMEGFVYFDKGSMATIGRRRAVAVTGTGRRWPRDVRTWKTTGLVAWLLWVFVHIFALVGFRNRLIVFFEWVRSYVFWKRSARVILHTKDGPFSEIEREAVPPREST